MTASVSITVDVAAPNGGTYRITYERPGPVTQDDVEQDLHDLGGALAEHEADIDWAVG